MMDTLSHPNEPWGPKGTEFFLPAETDKFGGWCGQFAATDPHQTKALIRKDWNLKNKCVKALSKFFEKFSPRSIYELESEPDGKEHFLLFESAHMILFIPEPTKFQDTTGVHSDVLELINSFDGYQFGYNPGRHGEFLMPDSGFKKRSELKLIDREWDPMFWQEDQSVLGGCYFYSNPVGNQFYCRPDGTIAKWTMSTLEIRTVFNSIFEFSEFFAKENLSGEYDSDSPLS